MAKSRTLPVWGVRRKDDSCAVADIDHIAEPHDSCNQEMLVDTTYDVCDRQKICLLLLLTWGLVQEHLLWTD